MSDDLDFVDEVVPPTLPRGKGRKFDDGLQGATRRQTGLATGRPHRTHGEFVQLTFRLPDEAVSRIEAMARAAGVTKEDMKRWVVWQGLLAWERGERPAVEEAVVKRAVRMDW